MRSQRTCPLCGGDLRLSHREYVGGRRSVRILRCAACGHQVRGEPQDDDAQPQFGAWVPAEGRDTLLSSLAQSHLQPGRLYHWRVVAWNAQGQVVARSALQEMRTP